ncbi:MAG: A/G-specific adenine glycosylase [Acidobacteriota bacterium]|nr:A/G-specific adenine glycosylase [Acidobacteriota bacterium]
MKSVRTVPMTHETLDAVDPGLPSHLGDAETVAKMGHLMDIGAVPAQLDAEDFRRRLMPWYREHARLLPWRGIHDPYAIWLSEIMLQQTQVATVLQRYVDFLERFPTLQSLAEAEEADVLAMWSGLGYYNRVRMLRKAAQFVVRELGGKLPGTAAELRTLSGVGPYTAAAIASIAFGESMAVVDGNVERVLLRLTGHLQDKTTAGQARLQGIAQSLMPPASKKSGVSIENAPGDHNQAMMELGATICVPRGPLCLECPVVALCRTRGEHPTVKREKRQTRRVAYLLAVRYVGERTEVLLEQRSSEASLMAEMFELPALPLDAVEGRAPTIRVRHSITNTNYEVEVFRQSASGGLLDAIPANDDDLHWVALQQLPRLPLTGLARKCLGRLGLIEIK